MKVGSAFGAGIHRRPEPQHLRRRAMNGRRLQQPRHLPCGHVVLARAGRNSPRTHPPVKPAAATREIRSRERQPQEPHADDAKGVRCRETSQSSPAGPAGIRRPCRAPASCNGQGSAAGTAGRPATASRRSPPARPAPRPSPPRGAGPPDGHHQGRPAAHRPALRRSPDYRHGDRPASAADGEDACESPGSLGRRSTATSARSPCV